MLTEEQYDFHSYQMHLQLHLESLRSKYAFVRQVLQLLFDTLLRQIKVVPYTFVRMGVPVREDTYSEPSACEVGWPVPFLPALVSPEYPLGTHLLLGEQ